MAGAKESVTGTTPSSDRQNGILRCLLHMFILTRWLDTATMFIGSDHRSEKECAWYGFRQPNKRKKNSAHENNANSSTFSQNSLSSVSQSIEPFMTDRAITFVLPRQSYVADPFLSTTTNPRMALRNFGCPTIGFTTIIFDCYNDGTVARQSYPKLVYR